MRIYVRCAVLVALGVISLAVGSLPAKTVRTIAIINVPVLVYHKVAPHGDAETSHQRLFKIEPAVFEAQMLMLRDHGYTVISLGALTDALVGRSSVPARAVVITFDDGWETQFQYAFPVLARLGFTATFFVFTSPIGRDARFMTWPQLSQMQVAGMSIGSHSRTHPYLSRSGALTREIAGSRVDIERALGIAPEFFAYPFGESGQRLTAAVRDAGYRAARGFGGGAKHRPADLWNLHSIPVTANMSAFRRILGLPATPSPPRQTRLRG